MDKPKFHIKTDQNEYLSNTGQISLFSRDENKMILEYVTEETFHIKNNKDEYACSLDVPTKYKIITIIIFKSLPTTSDDLLIFKYEQSCLTAYQIFDDQFCKISSDAFGFFSLNNNNGYTVLSECEEEISSQMVRSNGKIIEHNISFTEQISVCYETLRSKKDEFNIYNLLLLNGKSNLVNTIYYISHSMCSYDNTCKCISDIKNLDGVYVLNGYKLNFNVKKFIISNVKRIMRELAEIFLYIEQIDILDFLIDTQTCSLKLKNMSKILHYKSSELSFSCEDIQDQLNCIIDIHIEDIKSSPFYKSLN